jgi:phage gp46-like protein
MARDIKLIYNRDNFDFDISFENSDLIREEGLESAVFISLYCDRRAKDDDNLVNDEQYRGWWGDQLEENNDEIGSRLWLLKRAKTTQENIELARQAIIESLQWMLDDSVAASIEVEVERNQEEPENNKLFASIKIFFQDGNSVAYKFQDLWEAQVAI